MVLMRRGLQQLTARRWHNQLGQQLTIARTKPAFAGRRLLHETAPHQSTPRPVASMSSSTAKASLERTATVQQRQHHVSTRNQELFQTIEKQFPSERLDKEKWQILAISALSAAGQNDVAADLYTYLIESSAYATPEQRQALVRRLREAMVKLVSVVGVPKPLETIFQIAERERKEDRDYSFSREKWSSGPENIARGKAWLDQIYRHNYASITTDYMAAHRDFRWISEEITYGLYLSDHSILDGVDTELVVLAGIMMQNLPRETGWHLRGIRRIGVENQDVARIWECIVDIGHWSNVPVDRLPQVDDIEHEVQASEAN